MTIKSGAPVLMNLEATKHGDLLMHLRDPGGSGRPVEGCVLALVKGSGGVLTPWHGGAAGPFVLVMSPG